MDLEKIKISQSSRSTCFEQTYFFLYPLYLAFIKLSTNTHALISDGGDPEMVLCIPGITISSLRRQTLGQVAAKVSPSRSKYVQVQAQNRMCGSTPLPNTQKHV